MEKRAGSGRVEEQASRPVQLAAGCRCAGTAIAKPGPTILILYYSRYGNNHRLALEVARGVTDAGGEVRLRLVPEPKPTAAGANEELLNQARAAQRDVAVATVADLADIDGIVLGSPPQFGTMCVELRDFLYQAGDLWQQSAWDGTPAGVFSTSSTMSGGEQDAMTAMMSTLLHHGALLVGVPYAGAELTTGRETGTPYEPPAVISPLSGQPPGAAAMANARALGRRVTQFAGCCRAAAGTDGG